MCKVLWTSAVALVAAALGSCTDNTGPGEKALLTGTLAQFTSVESYFSSGLGKGGAPEVGAAGNLPSSCPYSTADSSFVCPQVTSSGVGVTRKYQLLNGAGVPLSAYDASSVAAIRVVSAASGTLSTVATFFSLATTTTFTSAGDHTYSGLLTGAGVINGQGTTTASLTRSGKTTTTTSVRVVSKVVPPQSSAEVSASSGWGFPMSGTVTSSVTGIDTLGVALTPATVETTFNGTATIITRVARTGATVTWTCTYEPKPTSPSANIFITCSPY